MLLRSRSFVFLILFSLFISCSKETVIPIIVTTDVHGAFDNLASVSTVVNEKRIENSDLILLDNGDFLQGTPMLYYFNNINIKEMNVAAAAMNFMKYDAVNAGNHDIETGRGVYKKVEGEFSFPWLCANITELKTPKTLFKPYTIITRDKMRIAVLALTTKNTKKALKPEESTKLIVEDMIDSADKWIKIIKQKEQPDAIVGLFHEGIDVTKEIAEKTDGFDIIFKGHDHNEHKTVVKSPDGSDVLILGASDRAGSIVSAEIRFRSKLKKISGNIVQTKEIAPDPGFAEVLKKYRELSDTYEFKVVADIGAVESETKIIDMIHSTLKKLTNADVSITAPVGKKVSITKGPITNRDLFNFYPFDNHPVVLKLTGLEIAKLLNYSETLQKTQSKYKRFYNDLSAVHYVTTPLENDLFYTVVMNSYHASDGGNLLSTGAGLSEIEINQRVVKIYPENIRDHLFGN